MKFKRIAAVVLTMIFIAGWPFGTLASDSASFGGSEVSCTVPEKYEFSIPDEAKINYPQTSVLVGEFVVGDILLKSGETLSVNLSLGPMMNNDDQDDLLSYNVIFSDPGEIDRSKIGCTYDLALSIDSTQFDAASPGTYSAPLLFRVVSNTTSEVVWEQTVYLEAIKHTTNERNHNQNGNDADTKDEDDSINGIVDDNEANQVVEPEPDVSIPATSDTEGSGYYVQKEDINDERSPLAQSETQNALIRWIIIACGIILVLCILYFLMRYKNSSSKS